MIVTEGVVTMTKPLVYNYRTAEDRIAELQAKVDKQMWEVMAVKGENTTLKCELDSVQSKYDTAASIIEIQHGLIKGYNNVLKMQEAELQRLRNEVRNNARNTNDNTTTL